MKTVKLASIAKVFNGYAFKSGDYSDSGYQVIRITNVQKGYISNKNQKFISLSSQSMERFVLHEGDILISLTGNVGRVGKLQAENLPAVLNQRVGKLIVTSNEVSPDYLFHFLNTKWIESKIIDKAKGVAQKNIGAADIESLDVFLPPIEKQNEIVSALNEISAIANNRKKTIALLDEYLRSTFLKMFSDDSSLEKVTLGSLSKNHKGSMRTGPFGSDLRHSEFTDSGIAVLGIDNAVNNYFAWDKLRFISHEKYEKLKRYTIHPRDVIITIMGTMGRSAVIPDDIPLAINTKHLAAITFDESKANPYFMCYALQADPRIIRQIKQRSKGAIMDGLNLTIIKSLEFSAWPVELQNKFEDIYHKVQYLKQNMKAQAINLELATETLAHKAFNGSL